MDVFDAARDRVLFHTLFLTVKDSDGKVHRNMWRFNVWCELT